MSTGQHFKKSEIKTELCRAMKAKTPSLLFLNNAVQMQIICRTGWNGK